MRCVFAVTRCVVMIGVVRFALLRFVVCCYVYGDMLLICVWLYACWRVCFRCDCLSVFCLCLIVVLFVLICL